MTPRELNMDSQDKRKSMKHKRGRGGSNNARKQRKKKEEDSDIDGEIRCHCGSSHDDGASIQCEQCLYWQHFVCHGITNNNVPESHICNSCAKKKASSSNLTNGKNSTTERGRKKSKNDSESDSDSSQTQDTDEINKSVENGSPTEETVFVPENSNKRGRAPKTQKEKKKIKEDIKKEENEPTRSESPSDKNRNKLTPKTPKQNEQNDQLIDCPQTPILTPLVDKNEINKSVYGKKKAWAKQFKEEKLLEQTPVKSKISEANLSIPTEISTPNTSEIKPKAIHIKKQIQMNFQNSQIPQNPQNPQNTVEKTNSSPSIPSNPAPTPPPQEEAQEKRKFSLKDYQNKKKNEPKPPPIETSLTAPTTPTISQMQPLTEHEKSSPLTTPNTSTSPRLVQNIDSKWENREWGKLKKSDSDNDFRYNHLRDELESNQAKKIKTLPIEVPQGFEPISPTHESSEVSVL